MKLLLVKAKSMMRLCYISNVGVGGDAVDIAVDPIEGTRMTAMGQSNALAVLAIGEKGSF
ncbi:fructose-bisphosphatase class II [Vibrio chagasii]|nr:fructose-bisphosphatase class II [Vibrio chagasii]